MQSLEVSGALRPIYGLFGVKRLKEPRFYAMCITHMKNNRSFTETHLKNQYTYFHISTLLYLHLTLSVPAKNVIEYVFLLLTQNKLFHSL